MHEVVHVPQVVIVGHGNIKLLHELRTCAAARDSALNLELRVKEVVILGLNLVNHIRRVDAVAVAIKVNSLELLSTARLPIVVVQDGRQLGVLITGARSRGSGPQTVKPLGRQLIVYHISCFVTY